jgi:F-type H+-transporting ATPase subunit epsilon
MSQKFTWSVSTPDGTVASGEAAFIVVPTTNGELGIMAAHAALVSSVSPGRMRVTSPDEQGTVRTLSVGAGVVDVRDNEARVLVTSARVE